MWANAHAHNLVNRLQLVVTCMILEQMSRKYLFNGVSGQLTLPFQDLRARSSASSETFSYTVNISRLRSMVGLIWFQPYTEDSQKWFISVLKRSTVLNDNCKRQFKLRQLSKRVRSKQI